MNMFTWICTLHRVHHKRRFLSQDRIEMNNVIMTSLYVESGNEKCFRLLKRKNKRTHSPESVLPSFCPHADKVTGNTCVSFVCGDLKSALHNIDVCGCVFMHGTKCNLWCVLFYVYFYFKLICISHRNCYWCFNFFAQSTKGEKQSWVLAGSQICFEEVPTISSEVPAFGPTACRWHQNITQCTKQ